MYEVEYADIYKTAMSENEISNNLLAQVDQYRQRFVLFDKIIYYIPDGTEIKEEDAFIQMENGNKQRRKTTKRW